jgi:peptidoglycan/xylan/chitin deacetylase (PgdA/CDA1 family)
LLAMIELAILFACTAALCTLLLATWRRLRGRSARRGQAARRVVVAGIAAALVMLSGAWRLSNSRAFQLLGESVTRVHTERKMVALTFDDGPTPEHTGEVLDILRGHGVPATFFVTGAALAQHPAQGQALVRAGHELGNHSYSHQRMVGKSLSFIADELEETDRLIRAAGHAGPIHFRPPFGKKLVTLPYYLSRTGRSSILWDIEPESHRDVAGSAERIVAHVLERARPGSIVLLHVMYAAGAVSRQALPGIIAGLKERGFELVPLSRLLAER